MYTLRAVQVCGYAKVDMTFGVPGPLDKLEIWEALQVRAISSACLMLYRGPRLPRQGMSVTKLRQAQLHLVGRIRAGGCNLHRLPKRVFKATPVTVMESGVG